MNQTLKEDKNRYNVTWIINSLPNKYKSKAFLFLRYITCNYDIKWNRKGAFKYKKKINTKFKYITFNFTCIIK